MSESTCQALCCRGAGCLSGEGTYLPGTVCAGVQARHCAAGMQAVKAVSEPTCPTLCAGVFKHGQNLPARHCVAGLQAV